MAEVMFNIPKLADQLSDEQIELLIRHYVQKQLQKVTKNPGIIMLVINTGYGSATTFDSIKWVIGHTGANQTEGEILSACMVERVRRETFSQTCTLRLLEASAETPTTDVVDEIPF